MQHALEVVEESGEIMKVESADTFVRDRISACSSGVRGFLFWVVGLLTPNHLCVPRS